MYTCFGTVGLPHLPGTIVWGNPVQLCGVVICYVGGLTMPTHNYWGTYEVTWRDDRLVFQSLMSAFLKFNIDGIIADL